MVTLFSMVMTDSYTAQELLNTSNTKIPHLTVLHISLLLLTEKIRRIAGYAYAPLSHSSTRTATDFNILFRASTIGIVSVTDWLRDPYFSKHWKYL